MLLAGIICSGGSLLVTKSGRSTYVIVVPENSTAQNNRAATLLKRNLQAATGADIPIVYESRRRNRSGIFVGPVKTAVNNKAGAEKVPAVFFNKPHIFIGADSKADPQRAAAQFLSKYCGIAWNPRPVMGKPHISELRIYPSGVIKPADKHDTETLDLCLDGKTGYVIVVPVQTTRQINQAASELRNHLNAATTATFAIVDERLIRGRKAIFVGNSPAAEKTFKKQLEGINFANGNIWINAGKDATLLKNTYRFIENNCGIPLGVHRHKNVVKMPSLKVTVLRNAPEGALVISKDGKSQYAVVIPVKKNKTFETAANELAAHLNLMTGVEFPVITENEYKGQPAFFIGPVSASKKVFDDHLFTKDRADTVAVKFQNQNIYLSGKGNSGPLYAVYTFLEDYCGIRWWTQGESFIPRYQTFGVMPKDYRYSPVLISRGAFYRAASGVQAARSKANDFYSYVPEGYGDRMLVIGKVHTFNQFMPPAKYFDKHPEWFPLIGGRRQKGDDYQLCLTNEEMTAEFTRICLQKIAENPEYPLISISQNDSDKKVPCACPACSAVVKEDNESGLYMRFVNKVAAEIKKKYPGKFVQTLAYHESLMPPKKTVPLDNVIILYCPISMDYARSLESGKNNEKSRNYLQQWSKITDKLFIWNYVCNFKNYVYPHPNYRNLAADLRYFIRNNAIGIFEQGDFGCSIGDFVRPRAWILQKLLWDPSLDEQALAAEFFNGYYGPAGPALRKYLRFMCDELEKSGAVLETVYTTPDFWLTYDIIVKARKIYAEAEKAVAGHPVFAERVRRERLPLDYAYLNSVAAKIRSDRLNGVSSGLDRKTIMAMAEEFIRESAKWKPIQFREHVTFAGHAEQLRDKLAATFDVPFDKIAEIAPEIRQKNIRWDFLPPSFCVPYRIGKWSFYANDPAALAGQAIRMPNNHQQWAYQATIGSDYSADGLKWKFKFEVRCDASVNHGKALSVGIYDTKKKKSLYTATIDVAKCRGKKYVFIDTPAVELGEETLIWAAPEKRKPSEVTDVFVSSVLMISEKESK